MTRPLDRRAEIAERGPVDREGGEFWVENPFELLSSGHNLSAFERNRLFLNLNGREFLDASFASHADLDSDSRSVVAADFDRDGAPDLLVGSVGGGTLRLLLNRFDDASRARLRLVGTESNRAGVGARVVAEADGRTLVRDLFPANGGTGTGPAEISLGLGAARRLARLEIRWPSGRVQTLTDLPVDVGLTVTEGDDRPVIEPLAPAQRR